MIDTSSHPLAVARFGYRDGVPFEAWRKQFDAAMAKDPVFPQDLSTLLHWGFDCCEERPNYDTPLPFLEQRLSLYLSLSQGYNGRIRPRNVKEGNWQYENEQNTSAQLVARKAWKVLCAKFFAMESEEIDRDYHMRQPGWLRHVRSKEILSKIFLLFSEGAFSAWWCEDDRQDHHEKIAARFFKELLSIIWTTETLGYRGRSLEEGSLLEQHKNLAEWARGETLRFAILGRWVSLLLPVSTKGYFLRGEPIMSQENIDLLRKYALLGEKAFNDYSSDEPLRTVDEALYKGSHFQYCAALVYLAHMAWNGEKKRSEEIKLLEARRDAAAADLAKATGHR